MSVPGKGDPCEPRPEELAAYADGELDMADRARIEAWFAQHPEAAAEVEALRGLGRLFEEAPPPLPTAAAWDGVLARIEKGIHPPAPPAGRRWQLAAMLAGLAAAAAVLLAIVLQRPQPLESTEDETPLPVVAAEEVEINSIMAADAQALVVGEPPVREALVLLLPGEVTVDNVKSDVRGMDPYYARDGSMTPMIIMLPRDEEP